MVEPEREPSPDGLRIRVLGPVSATCDGRLLDLGGPRQRAVLAVLLLARGAVLPAERLIADVWEGSPPPSATASLHAFISRLRSRLVPLPPGAGGIVSEAPGYALRLPAEAVDSWRFEELVARAGRHVAEDPLAARRMLEDALQLWQGPPLGDQGDCAWAEAEVARLTGLRQVAEELLLQARSETEPSVVLVPELERLVAEEPLREERWRLLALALYRANRQADALAALRRARATLAEELGLDPGPGLRALEADVLAQAGHLAPRRAPRRAPGPARTPPAGGGTAGGGPPAAPVPAGTSGGSGTSGTSDPALGRSRPDADELVDRDGEVEALRVAVGDAAAGQGRLVLLRGQAGIGKTRLLREARLLAEAAGLRVLSARGSELEQEFGFGVARQLLEPQLAHPEQRRQLLAGAAAAAAPLFEDTAVARVSDTPSFATVHGLYWAVLNQLRQGPLALLLDDLHWCDEGSLRFLAYLVRRLEGLPLCVVVTMRTGHRSSASDILDELAGEPVTVPIAPSPLGAEAVADLVRRRLGAAADDVFCAACAATTSGNPLLLRQLLRALQSEGVHPDASHADVVRALGSRAVSSMVLLRLRKLPPAATTTARALAVLGDGASLSAVATLAGVDEETVASATQHLADAEILRRDPPLAFVHPLVREAVYRDLAPGERQLRHDRAARLLARLGAPPEQVAAQLLQAPGRADPWAVGVLRRAGSEALRRGAVDGARTYLLRALEEPASGQDRAEVLLKLGRAESSRNGPTAIPYLQEAYATLADPARRAIAAQMLARTLVFAGPQYSPSVFARGALAELPTDLHDERQALTALERITAFMHGEDPRLWGYGTPAPRSGTGPGARMLAAETAWEQLCQAVPKEEPVRAAREALTDGLLYTVDNGLLWVVATFVLDVADEDVLPLWDDALAAAHSHGSLFAVLSVRLWRGFALLRRGELVEAVDSLLASIEQLQMWDEPTVGLPYASSLLAHAYLELDDLAQAGASLRQERLVHPGTDGARLLLEAEGAYHLAAGDPERALVPLRRARTLAPHVVNPAWRSDARLLAEALTQLGRPAEAVQLLEPTLAVARRWGAASTLAKVLRTIGVAQARLPGDDVQEAGLSSLQKSVDLLAGGPFRVEHGWSLLEHGRALQDRAPGAALSHLQEALRLAHEAGAARLRRHVVDQLAAMRVPAPRLPPAVTLTASERRVLDLVTAGQAVEDVAQALYVTPRTVQGLLASARRKSRGDLVVDVSGSASMTAQPATG